MKNLVLAILIVQICLAQNVLSCGVFTTPSSTYVLETDLESDTSLQCIRITGDNIVFDCRGHLISGTSNSTMSMGVQTEGNNITVKNCRIANFIHEILHFGNHTTTINNLVYANRTGCTGIATHGGHGIFRNNTFVNLTYGFEIRSYEGNANYNLIEDFFMGNTTYGIVSLVHPMFNNYTNGRIQNTSVGIYAEVNTNYIMFSNILITEASNTTFYAYQDRNKIGEFE